MVWRLIVTGRLYALLLFALELPPFKLSGLSVTLELMQKMARERSRASSRFDQDSKENNN